MQQYNRQAYIEIDSATERFTIRDLRIAFEVTQDLFGFPALAKLQVYNLAEATRQKFNSENAGALGVVRLFAGYQTPIQLFQGDIRNIIHIKNGVDFISEIYAGDGDRALRQSSVSRTFPAGTSLVTFLKEAARSFKAPLEITGLLETQALNSSTTISSLTKQMLDDLSETFNFYWSIQDGSLKVFERSSAGLVSQAVVISRDTGMINSPEITEIGANVTFLLNPLVKPYQVVKIEAEAPGINLGNAFFRRVNRNLGAGYYRVNQAVHSGDTRGNSWQTAIVGRTLNA